MADTPLQRRIARMIAMTGPMPLADYMQLCLNDPEHGYYTTRRAIGADGDFVTAPAVSQVFGELVGLWCAAVWQAIGAPRRFTLAEAGPGHGVMMADMLRAARIVPGFLDAARLQLIEASPAMAEIQRERLQGLAAEIEWVPALGAGGDGPLILVANEFLDAIPIRQFIKTPAGWRERCVALDESENLQWIAGAGLADSTLLPAGAEEAPDGAVFEHAPARAAWLSGLSEEIARRGGAGLIIDYGHEETGLGDTFQAVAGHAYADPLESPGDADLTAHVDFQPLCEAARNAGICAAPIVTQRDFLLSLGLTERVNALAQGKPDSRREEIVSAAGRLVAEEGMGKLFKVLALAGPKEAAALSGLPPFAED